MGSEQHSEVGRWTSFNQPSSIATGTVSSAFAYTPDRRYWQQVAQYANGTATTTYLGTMFQKVVGATTEYRHMIKAGSATIVVTRSTGSNNNTDYVTQDNLGSSSVVTDSTGAAQSLQGECNDSSISQAQSRRVRRRGELPRPVGGYVTGLPAGKSRRGVRESR
jgi:hypothetical protein